MTEMSPAWTLVTHRHNDPFPQRGGFVQQNALHKGRAPCFTKECRNPLGEEPTCFSGSNAARALDQSHVRYQRAAIWCQRDSVSPSQILTRPVATWWLGRPRVYGGKNRPGRQRTSVADARSVTLIRTASACCFPRYGGQCAFARNRSLSVPHSGNSLKRNHNRPHSKRKLCGPGVQGIER